MTDAEKIAPKIVHKLDENPTLEWKASCAALDTEQAARLILTILAAGRAVA